MAIVRICAEEVTDITDTYSATVTCSNPSKTPVAAGDECWGLLYSPTFNSDDMTLSFSFDINLEYLYEDANTTGLLPDYCKIEGETGIIVLPEELGECDCGLISTYSLAFSCDPLSITTSSTYVQGAVNVEYTVTNLCAPTAFCVSTVDCLTP
ncbi:MAG: hypothetical protein PHG06_20270 [Parabacteroides sp.]|nr:hypothetical protein [Parabacteroides sp.]